MEYSVKSGNPEKQRNACVIVGVFDRRKLSSAAAAFDDLSGGALSSVTRRGDMDGKFGQTLTLYNLPNAFCDRLLLVGLGKERDFDESRYCKITRISAQALLRTGARDAATYLTLLPVKGRDEAWKVRHAVLGIDDAMYRFEQMKSDTEYEERLSRMVLTVPTRRELDAGENAAMEAEAVASGIDMAKDLANLPGNICTPTYLAERAAEIAENFDKVDINVLEESDMQELGMGALLAVSRGSEEPAKLITLEYRGAGDEAPYVMVGKGLTFDAGGISLKPGAGMDEMKYDMCGGASVLGAIAAVAELDLPINVVAIVPASENMPDGKALKPGDIVTSMSGQTIEVLNTDAEGRLILCDALTYAERFNPVAIVDVATLTGACVVALGNHISGFTTNDRGVARQMRQAADAGQDAVWELPMTADYHEQLKSNFADVANIGGRNAGAITAACFLARFTRRQRWAHLDIAGTAWRSGKDKGATGRPVALLAYWLIGRAHAEMEDAG